MSTPDDTAALRSNIRLLGETLGLVLVEQEGRWLLGLEERARRLALAGRRGSEEAIEQLVAFAKTLELDHQGLVLRAFGVYFQLANIAEQHHRIRRRRSYER
jgi:phosphoenolpyruvate carboxylase